LIDTALDQQAAKSMGMESFEARAWLKVERAMGEASLILLTHEHADHLGGAVSTRNPAVLGRVAFNQAQLPGNRWTDLLHWPRVGLPRPTISGSQPVAVAPGVGVIPAPSHTPGSQMVFVRLANGREFLFTGDIATLAQSWQGLRARSRLVGDYLAPESRGEVFAWLLTIRALKAAAPGLVVLPGHDFEWVIEPKNETHVHYGFTRTAT
jgi:glyoxylase-like metal-dependent hydrolase (beta-lactamase superfamily II)